MKIRFQIEFEISAGQMTAGGGQKKVPLRTSLSDSLSYYRQLYSSKLASLYRLVRIRVTLATVSWLCLIVLLATLVYFRPAGVEFLVVGYLLVAVIFSIGSGQSFATSLIFLLIVAALQFLKKPALAESYAIAAYYLLAIGLLFAVFELRGQGEK